MCILEVGLTLPEACMVASWLPLPCLRVPLFPDHQSFEFWPLELKEHHGDCGLFLQTRMGDMERPLCPEAPTGSCSVPVPLQNLFSGAAFIPRCLALEAKTSQSPPPELSLADGETSPGEGTVRFSSSGQPTAQLIDECAKPTPFA